MRDVNAVCGQIIRLGRAGENLTRRVIFDLSGWIREYGDGTASLVIRRANDEQPYPVALCVSDGKAVWSITSADTAQEGFGQAQLRWTIGDTLAKSVIYTTYTSKALDAGTGDPWEGYLDAVQAAAAEAQAAATQAKDVVLHGPIPQNGTWWLWDAEKSEYVDSGKTSGVSEEYVQQAIADTVGDINTILDSINGEVV